MKISPRNRSRCECDSTELAEDLAERRRNDKSPFASTPRTRFVVFKMALHCNKIDACIIGIALHYNKIAAVVYRNRSALLQNRHRRLSEALCTTT